MLKNHKHILYSLIAIIILFFGYWYFFLSKKDTQEAQGSGTLVARNPASATTGGQTGQKTYDKEFVASLQAIQYITLDTSILDSPAYKALSFPEVPFQVDYNIPVGRRNPFLPIGSDSQGFVESAAQAPTVEPAVVTATTTPTPAPATTTLPSPRRR
jgi:hypothetical protein